VKITLNRQRLASLAKTGLLLAAVLGTSTLVCSCGSGESGEQRGQAPIPVVEAVQSRTGSLPLVQRLNGLVKARNQIAINSEVEGVIVDVPVHNGEFVKRGQVLVRLRDREFLEQRKQAQAGLKIAQAQTRQAEARLQAVRSEFDRTADLAAQEIVSRAEFETAEAQMLSALADLDLAQARVEQAEANLAEQDENLAQTEVRAPIAGHVGERNAEVGMLVDRNTRLFILGQLDSLYVEIVLSDKMLEVIEEDQSVDIFASGMGSPFIEAGLTRISPFLHPVSHSTVGEIEVDNPDGTLRPGMFVTVDVHYGESEQATLVPLCVLYEHPATAELGVFLTDESLDPASRARRQDDLPLELTEPLPFRFQPVTVIATGRMAAGIDGVAPGAWVVSVGQNLLGASESSARVRPVDWEKVEWLQRLQREDLMDSVVKGRSGRSR